MHTTYKRSVFLDFWKKVRFAGEAPILFGDLPEFVRCLSVLQSALADYPNLDYNQQAVLCGAIGKYCHQADKLIQQAVVTGLTLQVFVDYDNAHARLLHDKEVFFKWTIWRDIGAENWSNAELELIIEPGGISGSWGLDNSENPEEAEEPLHFLDCPDVESLLDGWQKSLVWLETGQFQQ